MCQFYLQIIINMKDMAYIKRCLGDLSHADTPSQ